MGIVIVSVIVAVVIGFTVFLGVRARAAWAAAQPQLWLGSERRVGVRWQPDAIQPWPGLVTAVQSIENVLVAKYGQEKVRAEGLMDFWVDVFPKNVPLKSRTNPAGVPAGGGTYAGYSELVYFFLGLKRLPRVLVMQVHSIKIRNPDTSVEWRGDLREANRSALFHEVFEHIIKWKLTGNMSGHTPHDSEWGKLQTAAEVEYARLKTALVAHGQPLL